MQNGNSYPHDLQQNTNDTKADHTEDREGFYEENCELDDTRINSELEDGMSMTRDKTRTDVESILSAKSLLWLTEANYNEIGLQREIYCHINMYEEIADNSHAQLNRYTISDKVHLESMRRRKITKSRQVSSHGREKGW